MRYDDEKCYVVVLNMSPVGHEHFELGVPTYGYFTEIINSEKDIYGGCNMCNFRKIQAHRSKKECNGFKYKLDMRVAPYAGIILEAKIR